MADIHFTHKDCSKCGERKDFSQYHAKPKGRFGLHSICKKCRSLQASQWAKREPDRNREIQREAKRRLRSTPEGRERLSRINCEYAKRHPEKIYSRLKERIKTDPVFAASTRARAMINRSISRMGYTKRSKAMEILGCDWEFFKAHIEKQFLPGMSWERIGEIHIDHIVPLSSAKTEEEVIALNHFTNLRPLWAAENLAKRDKRIFLV